MEYPIKDIKIERVTSFSTKRDGTPLVTQAGKPYKKVLIDVSSSVIDEISFNGKLSMLDFDGVADNWREGDLLTGKIIKDGDWWNFELPKVDYKSKIAELELENSELRRKILELERESLNEDDLPF